MVSTSTGTSTTSATSDVCSTSAVWSVIRTLASSDALSVPRTSGTLVSITTSLLSMSLVVFFGVTSFLFVVSETSSLV